MPDTATLLFFFFDWLSGIAVVRDAIDFVYSLLKKKKKKESFPVQEMIPNLVALGRK